MKFIVTENPEGVNKRKNKSNLKPTKFTDFINYIKLCSQIVPNSNRDIDNHGQQRTLKMVCVLVWVA